jgi:hypothetical protein
MGFFSNLKAASTVSTATQFARKHLEVEAACGTFKGDAKAVAEKLVLAVWQDVPGLADQTAKPTAVLVAAAALANGVKHFDATGNKALAQAFFRCLGTLLQYDVHKLVDATMLSPIDSRLWDIAHSPFDQSGTDR